MMSNLKGKLCTVSIIIVVISIGLLSAYLFYLNNILEMNRMKIDNLYSRANDLILQNKRVDLVLQGILTNVTLVKSKLTALIVGLKTTGVILSFSIFFYKGLSIYSKVIFFIASVLFFLFFRIGPVF